MLPAIGPDTALTPESIVSWLLEHPEVVTEDADSLSSVYDSDTESVSYDNAMGIHGFGQYVRNSIYDSFFLHSYVNILGRRKWKSSKLF